MPRFFQKKNETKNIKKIFVSQRSLIYQTKFANVNILLTLLV